VSSLRQRLRLFTWVALVAMFGLALAPSVSHALSARQASNAFTEICSSPRSGFGSGEPAGSAALHLEHCALCCVASAALGMPPAPVALVRVPECVARAIVPVREVAPARFAWLPPQARAPPLSS
jgi:hypothetical protein